MIPRKLIAARTAVLALAMPAALLAAQQVQDTSAEVVQVSATEAGWGGDPYLLAIDPVTGEKLGDIKGQIVLQHEGREFRFASQETADAFQANPQKFIPGVDARLVRDQLLYYPLATCLVSDEKLDEHAVNLVYRNRLVRLSRRAYQTAFLTDPESFIDKLDKAVIAKQRPRYAATTCPISGEALDSMGAPIEHVLGNRLIRLCCESCIDDLAKDPLRIVESYAVEPGEARTPREPGPS